MKKIFLIIVLFTTLLTGCSSERLTIHQNGTDIINAIYARVP